MLIVAEKSDVFCLNGKLVKIFFKLLLFDMFIICSKYIRYKCLLDFHLEVPRLKLIYDDYGI